jgi:3-carboxy-cis,cis-muconate cycloisomerase
MQAAVSDRAWLEAMLEAEAALASARERAGLLGETAAAEVRGACALGRFDLDALGREARASGNPVVPLARALREEAPGAHEGATSQDILDTAAMLVARRALELIDADLGAVAGACAGLADQHRATPLIARTLLQAALPTTFGLKTAGWLVAVAEARDALRSQPLAVQLGGPAGTLDSFGDRAIEVVEHFARELDLDVPELPWHTDRTRLARLGAELALAAGALAKIALDVELMAQTEVGEVAEPAGGGRGGSSSMPHKRNPVGSVITRACARRVAAASGVLIAAMEQEHERAAGAWHSEWQPFTEALALTGGAAAAMREVLEGLEVRPDRMAENLAEAGGSSPPPSVDALIDRALARYGP